MLAAPYFYQENASPAGSAFKDYSEHCQIPTSKVLTALLSGKQPTTTGKS